MVKAGEMAGQRNREEAVNTQLAILISRYGVTADGETIHVHGKHRGYAWLRVVTVTLY